MQGQPEKAGRINRVSADEVETLVAKSLRDRLKPSTGLDCKSLIEAHVTRVDLRADRMIIDLKPSPLSKGARRGRLGVARLSDLPAEWPRQYRALGLTPPSSTK